MRLHSLISRLLYDHSTIVLTSVLLMVMSLIVQPMFIQPLHAQNESKTSMTVKTVVILY